MKQQKNKMKGLLNIMGIGIINALSLVPFTTGWGGRITMRINTPVTENSQYTGDFKGNIEGYDVILTRDSQHTILQIDNNEIIRDEGNEGSVDSYQMLQEAQFKFDDYLIKIKKHNKQ